jgi:hypothetical protein
VAAVPGATAADLSTWIPPMFVIPVDPQTSAYAFPLTPDAVRAAPGPGGPGWYFAFHEHAFRLRFGFDTPPDPPADPPPQPQTWNDLDWSLVPQSRGFAIAGAPLASPAQAQGPDDPRWSRDATDIARITLQRPFRVLISARRLIGG